MQAVQFWSLATLMVLAATAMLVVPLYWRERRLPNGNAWLRWEPLAFAAMVPVAALSLYWFIGNPEMLASTPTAAAGDVASLHAAAMRANGNGRSGGDLDQAITRLRTRLAAAPSDAAGWRLLAQAYEFKGQAAEAADARSRADALESDAAPGPLPVADQSSDALVQRAQELRRRREFPAAVAAFADLARRGSMSADLWADYADALGGARGGLDAEAAKCIDAALRLDPEHIKALWLRASLETQQRDHRAAINTWQKLAKLLPPESPDSRIIAANLAEARANLAGGNSANVAGPTLRGDVRLDPRWQARVTAGSVLFVYARAADERGPPLAVWRTQAGGWPVRFSLGDADAMVPGRRLSDFHRVILEARVSRSGNALPEPGDLRAVTGVLDPRNAPEQRLVIAEEVGAGVQGG